MKPTFVILLLIVATIATSALGILTIPQIYITFGIAFALILFMYSALVNPFRTEVYHIHKGWHYSIVGFFSMFLPYVRAYNKDKNDILFTFRLFDKCHYDTSEPNMGFWNKLCGAALKGGVHGNSIRIAWRPSEDITRYQVCFYWYEHGIRCESDPMELVYGKYYFAELTETTFGIYDFNPAQVNIEPIKSMSFTTMPNFYQKSIRCLLLPYFGGKPRAMKKFNIHLETKKI